MGTTEPRATRTCTNGHSVPEDNQFCGVCGSPVHPMEIAPRTCLNGHTVPTNDAYCGECGEQVTESSVKPGATCTNGHQSPPGSRYCETCGVPLAATAVQVPTGAPKPQRSSGKVVAVLGAVLLALVVGLILFANRSHGDSAASSASVGTATDSPTPLSAHEICVNQLYRVAADLSNHVGNQMEVNGVTDPFYQEGIQLSAQFAADVVMNGRNQAQSKVEAAVSDWCRNHGNPHRANTDEQGNPE